MERLTLGALGGPETFGGQAAAMVLEAYPEFAELRYFERAGDAFGGPDPVEARCVPVRSTRTGPYDFAHRELLRGEPPRHVVGEVQHHYHCALLGRPGAEIDQVRLVLGHTGSIVQSRDWLGEHLPNARVEVVDTSSLAAGARARDGDGSVAAVGTLPAAEALGLDVLARDIDGGSIGLYWVFALAPRLVPRPSRVVAAGRSVRDGSLSGVVAGLLPVGFTVTSVWCDTRGDLAFDSGWVAAFEGTGELSEVASAVGRVVGARLAGAFVGPGQAGDGDGAEAPARTGTRGAPVSGAPAGS